MTPAPLPGADVRGHQLDRRYLRQGGVRWRDTFYPLDLLRKGTVR
jgi:hypothetical protein